MTERVREHNRPGYGIAVLLQAASYIFLFFVLTGMKKFGDLHIFIPYITGALLIAYIALFREYAVLRSGLFVSLGAYVAVSYLLAFSSFDPAVSLVALNREILPGLILFLALHFQSETEEKARGLLPVFLAALVLLLGSAFGTYAKRLGKKGIGGHLFPNVHFLKLKLHHNVFAMKLNVLLPFAALAAACARTRTARYLLGAVCLISAAAAVMSLSRGGWAGLLVASCMFIVYLSRGRMRPLAAAAALCGAFAVAAAAAWVAVPQVRERVLMSTDELTTVHGRTEIWEHYLEAVRQRPLTGWGYGDRIIWDGGPLLQTKDAEAGIPEQFRIGTHNTLLFVLFHQGVAGLGAYLLFVIAGIVVFVREMVRRQKAGQWYLLAIAAAFLGVVVIHSAVETVPFMIPCLLFGLLSGLRQWQGPGTEAGCRP